MADDPNWKKKISADKLFVGLEEINHGFLPTDLLHLIASYGHKKILTEREVGKLYLETKYQLLDELENEIKTDEDREAFEKYKSMLFRNPTEEEIKIPIYNRSPIFRNFINYLHEKGYDYKGHLVSPSILYDKIKEIFGEEKADDMTKKFKHGGIRHMFQKAPRRTF